MKERMENKKGEVPDFDAEIKRGVIWQRKQKLWGQKLKK